MSRPLTRADADRLLLNGAQSELFVALSLVCLLREAQEERAAVEPADHGGLTSPGSRQLAVLELVEAKLQAALVAIGSAA